MATNNAVNNAGSPYKLNTRLSADIANCTGDGTVVAPVIFDTVDYQFGIGYDNATGIFTATIPGVYRFDSTIVLSDVSGANTLTDYHLAISTGDTIGGAYQSSANCRTSESIEGVQTCGEILLAEGDTVQASVVVSGSTLTTNILAGSFLSIYFVG
jgi:hypothetical protein